MQVYSLSWSSARFPLLFLITTSNLGQKPACVSDLTGSGRHPQASTMSLDMMSRRWGKRMMMMMMGLDMISIGMRRNMSMSKTMMIIRMTTTMILIQTKLVPRLL